MEKQTQFGNRIRALRVARAWSQEQLAEIAGVSARTVQRVENGEPASFETLRAIASAFDLDVKDLTEEAGETREPAHDVTFLSRITRGTDLCAIVGGAHMSQTQHDELGSEEEVELVGSFLQDLHDLGDLWSDLEPMAHTKEGFRLAESLKDLDARGFWVFGERRKRNVRMGIPPSAHLLDVATIVVVRKDSPTIINVSPEEQIVAPEAPSAP